MRLKLHKIVHFLQNYADLSKKSNHALSENNIFLEESEILTYYEILKNKIPRKVLIQ